MNPFYFTLALFGGKIEIKWAHLGKILLFFRSMLASHKVPQAIPLRIFQDDRICS